MDFPRKTQLAASFVVTVSALAGCRKQTVDNDPVVHEKESAYVSRYGDRCTMGTPQHCPKGASCNPPPPEEIDCPPNLRDAGEPAPTATARPAGKEDWLRLKPHLWASRYGAGYTPERFCAPPPKPFECMQSEMVALKSKPIANADAAPANRYAIEPFVYKDGMGTCHKVPAFECGEAECTSDMPAGEPAPCP